jgi:hypothetical protein
MNCQVKDCDGDAHATVRHKVTGEVLEVCTDCADEMTSLNPNWEAQNFDMA